MDYPPNPPQYPNTSYPPNAPTYQVPAQPGTYPPPPYPPGRPPYQKPPKKGAPWGWIVAIILVALAAYFSGYEAGASGREPGSQPSQTITQASTTTTQGTAAAATSKPTAPAAQPKWTTTHTYTGTGGKNTEVFTVGDHWKLLWECTVVPSGYDTAPFYLITYQADKTPITDGEVSSSCKTRKGDTEVHSQPGKVYINVNTVVDIQWKLTIQELK
jgi:hypothetical protein